MGANTVKVPRGQSRQVVALRLWKREIKHIMMSAEVEAGTLHKRDVFFSSRSNKLCPAGLEESQRIPSQTVEKEKVARAQSRQVVALRLRKRGIKQIMLSAKVDAGKFEDAGCVLLVEV